MSLWKNIEIVYADDKTELRVAYIPPPDDSKTLGNLMGHCAGNHKVFESLEVWHYFSYDRVMKDWYDANKIPGAEPVLMGGN